MAQKEILINGVTWTKDKVKQSILTTDAGVFAALMRIYSHQTKDEKSAHQTKHINGLGFNGVDAEILTSFAQQYEQRKSLSPKQVALARKKLQKYAGQIFNYMVEVHAAPVKTLAGMIPAQPKVVTQTLFNA